MNYRNGAPVYPKPGSIANIYIPTRKPDLDGEFPAHSLNLNGDRLNLVGSSFKEGEMIKYYQVKSKFDRPDYSDANKSFGTFTGKSIEWNGVVYHQIVWLHEWFTHGFLGWNAQLQTEYVGNAFVMDKDVTSSSQSEAEAIAKDKKQQELDEYLASITDDNSDKKSLSASGSITGIADKSTSILLGAIIVLVIGLLSFGAYKKFKK